MATNRAGNRPKQVSMIHGKQTKHRWAVKKDIQSSRRKERFEQWLSLSLTPFACFTYVEETGIKSVSSKANSKQKEKEGGGLRDAGLTSLVLGADTGAVLSVLCIQEGWRALGRKQHAEGSRNVSTVAVAASPALFQQEVRSSMCERVCQCRSV